MTHLEARDLSSGHTWIVDPKCPKKEIAAELGYAPASGRCMYRDTRAGGATQIGYVFGRHWVELNWIDVRPWKVATELERVASPWKDPDLERVAD